jgi:hypothetical protein
MQATMVLAAIEEVMVFLIPITALMIPIVAILTYHQRKMAEIVHQGRGADVPNQEIQMLRREVQEIKEIVHQQTIAIDSIRSLPSVESRFSEVDVR